MGEAEAWTFWWRHQKVENTLAYNPNLHRTPGPPAQDSTQRTVTVQDQERDSREREEEEYKIVYAEAKTASSDQ